MVWLALEVPLLFVCIPLLFYFRVFPNVPIPVLLGAAILAYLWLRQLPNFDRHQLWNFNGMTHHAGPVVLRSTVICTVIGLAVYWFAPHLLFRFPRTAPAFWAIVMVLYPVVSVYPQEILFRAFFFQRYQFLFGSTTVLILASASAFGFAHLVFGNWLSVILSFGGGVLFAYSYTQSGSLLLAGIEHAIYGNFIFTIGLGQFFYHGARK